MNKLLIILLSFLLVSCASYRPVADLKGVLHILNKDAEKEIIDIQVKQSAERHIEMQNAIQENQ